MISLTKIDKKSVKIMVLGSLLLVVVFIMGVSYAYTHANFFNVENSTTIAVNGGKMEIVYNDPSRGGVFI